MSCGIAYLALKALLRLVVYSVCYVYAIYLCSIICSSMIDGCYSDSLGIITSHHYHHEMQLRCLSEFLPQTMRWFGISGSVHSVSKLTSWMKYPLQCTAHWDLWQHSICSVDQDLTQNNGSPILCKMAIGLIETTHWNHSTVFYFFKYLFCGLSSNIWTLYVTCHVSGLSLELPQLQPQSHCQELRFTVTCSY